MVFFYNIFAKYNTKMLFALCVKVEDNTQVSRLFSALYSVLPYSMHSKDIIIARL